MTERTEYQGDIVIVEEPVSRNGRGSKAPRERNDHPRSETSPDRVANELMIRRIMAALTSLE